jgi:hypothetical protein
MKNLKMKKPCLSPSLTETSLKSLSGVILVRRLRKIAKSDYKLLNVLPFETNLLRLDGFS